MDIICARRATYGLIVDFNPKNAEFIRKTIELITSCESREAFKTSMIQYLGSLRGPERELFFHADQRGSPIDRIEQELEREGSWLQSEADYQYLKGELVSKQRLIAITEDMRNHESFSRMRKFLDDKKIAIDTLYMSNISNFMRSVEDRNSFVRSIRNLLAPESIFISCPKITQPEGKPILLRQRVIMGAALLADPYDTSKLFEESS